MNLPEKLRKIADKTENEEDKIVLLAAAMKLSPLPEPRLQKAEKIGDVFYSMTFY